MGCCGSRRSSDSASHALGTYPAAGEDAVLYPELVAFLSRMKYDDGSARTPGTVLLFCEGGRLKVCFNDKDACMVGFKTLDSLDTLLADAERILDKDEADWRPAGERRSSGGRR